MNEEDASDFLDRVRMGLAGMSRADHKLRFDAIDVSASVSDNALMSALGVVLLLQTVDDSMPMWDNPTMIVTLDSKRRVSIPAALAPTTPGDQFDATFDADDDVVILRRVKRKSDWLEVWKQCPAPMDDLPQRSREMPKKLKL